MLYLKKIKFTEQSKIVWSRGKRAENNYGINNQLESNQNNYCSVYEKVIKTFIIWYDMSVHAMPQNHIHTF